MPERKLLDQAERHRPASSPVEGLSLLKGNNTGSTNEYLWLVYGTVSGGGAANQQVDEIKAFGASVSPMLDYVERGSWFADSQDSGQEKALRS